MKKLLISSKSFVFLMSTINFSSLRLDHLIQLLNTSSVLIGLELVFFESLLDSHRASALFVVQRRTVICSFSESQLGFSLMLEPSELTSCTGLTVLTWQRNNDWLGNKLSSREWQACLRPLALLAPRWTVVKRAKCRWWRRRTRGHSWNCSRLRILDVRFSSLRDVLVVGLTVFERVVLGKGAKVLISWSAQGICPPHRARQSWWPRGKTRR